MAQVLIVGGYDPENDAENMVEDLELLGKNLGREVIKQGHMLLSGCLTHFDRIVAEGAREAIQEMDPRGLDSRLKGYVLSDHEPVFDFGNLQPSKLQTWDPAEGVDIVPEPIEQADAVIFVQGYQGVNRAAIWSELVRKPILPIARFGGASERLYHKALRSFDEYYAGRITRNEFEALARIGIKPEKLASDTVSLIKRVLVSNTVAVMMSYTLEDAIRDNLLNSFEGACEKYGYEIDPVTELTDEKGIVSAIHAKIQQAAFILADFTELKPNVFYEFGYALGIGKPFVVSARKGTDLPFDIHDVPTQYWEDNWAVLQNKLSTRVSKIAEIQGKLHLEQ